MADGGGFTPNTTSTESITTTDILEVIGFVSVVAYAYTLGTFQNLGIPYYPDFSSSLAHYVSTVFFAPIGMLVFWITDKATLSGFISIAALIIFAFLITFYFKKDSKKSSKPPRSAYIDTAVAFIVGLLQSGASLYIGTTDLLQSAKDVRWFAVALYLVGITHIITICYCLMKKTNPFILVGMTAFACMTSYCITKSQSGNLFPYNSLVRFKADASPLRLVWADSANIFAARCSKNNSWTLEGYTGGEKFYSNYLNDTYHRGICDEDFRSKRQGKQSDKDPSDE